MLLKISNIYGHRLSTDRALEISKWNSARSRSYKCINCSISFGSYMDYFKDDIKVKTTKKKHEFCSKSCRKEYREGFRTIPTFDVPLCELIQNEGLDIYEPAVYSVDADILREAETYESRSIYNWECFRFFVLLNKTRSGQFKNKPEGTGSLKNV